MSEVILKVDHLKKYFPVKAKMFSGSKGTVHAVDDVSFEIRKGETFGLVGESGCGKSTLSRTILNLVPADGGTIIFNGEDITNLKGKKMEKIRRKMRMIFQKPYGSLNPREKVAKPLPPRVFGRPEAENRNCQGAGGKPGVNNLR